MIYTFGCSLTYGQWLEDNTKDNQDLGFPSKFAWPGVLSKQLKQPVTNISTPGASNKEIWHNIVTTKFTPTDTVIILWTHFDRWCVIDNDDYIRLHPRMAPSDLRDAYYGFIHNSNDIRLDFLVRVNHVKQYLDNLGVTNYHFHASESQLSTATSEWSTVQFEKPTMSALRIAYPHELALDDKHPGNKIHELFAEQVIYAVNKY